MTLSDWLASRRPPSPPALATRVAEALRGRWDDDASTIYEAAIDAAVSLLTSVVSRPSSGRECALDLLTADALTTYAFEFAAAEPDALTDRANQAMRRLAATGVTDGGGGGRAA